MAATTSHSALSGRVQWGALMGVVVLAAAWRLWLGTQYAGWEESDYGNLAMIEGVRAGHFLHYDMNHMPGYYAVSAVVHAIVQDAVVAGRAVALLGGVGAGRERLAGASMGGTVAALLTALWLIPQPEFALYAASTLREPLYSLGLVGFVVGLVLRRPTIAGVAGALAFSVRFDALLILGAAAAVAVWGERRPIYRWLRTVGPIIVAAGAWSVYCRIDHGTFAFWSHAVAVNVETGLGGEAEAPGQWVIAGIAVAGELVGWLLPWRLGWGVWLAALLMAVVTPWTRPGPERALAATATMATGFWAAVGFVGQHDPVHNLYWKWMMPLVPLLVPLAAVGWARVWARSAKARVPVAIALALVVVQAAASHARETHRQVALSHELYAPQVAVARWVEAEISPDTPLLLDNIPACWVNRRPHERPLVSWFDVPVAPGDRDALGQWLTDEGIPWVLWFREDWTQAPRIAPALAAGGVVRAGEVVLVERSREDSYGWILYEARGQGIPVHTGGPPPAVDLGASPQ